MAANRTVDPASRFQSTSGCSGRCRSTGRGSLRSSYPPRRWNCSATCSSIATVGTLVRRSRHCSGRGQLLDGSQVPAAGAVAAAVGPGRAATSADAGLGSPCARRVAARHRAPSSGRGRRLVDVPGARLSRADAGALEEAVELYHGDLIETLYSDWCIYERDRLQLVYLAMLEKLMGYCEDRQRYPQGLPTGSASSATTRRGRSPTST